MPKVTTAQGQKASAQIVSEEELYEWGKYFRSSTTTLEMRKAIVALVTGESFEAAAVAAGVSIKTLKGWSERDDFLRDTGYATIEMSKLQ